MTHTEQTTSYVSPVPVPALDAAPAELYTGIYGMPQFVTIRSRDLRTSTEFWTQGLGFFVLFEAGGTLVHLRRWAFQDVLLIAADADSTPDVADATITVSVACVLGQLPDMERDCERLLPGSTGGIRDTPWNARELAVATPEGAHVLMTAAKPLDVNGAEAEYLRELGIELSS